MNPKYYPLILVLLLSLFSNPCICQPGGLAAYYLPITLPSRAFCSSPYYDGQDTIYLFGSCNVGPFTQILAFSISSETISMVGSLPDRATSGSVQGDPSSGNVFYFGGGPSSSEVYRYSPSSNSSSLVATLSSAIYYYSSLEAGESSSTVFLLGGSSQLWTFDMSSLEATRVGTFPWPIGHGAAIRVGNKAYVFDDLSQASRSAMEFNLENYEVRQVGPETLPLFNYTSAAIYDGRFVYVLGGYGPYGGVPTDGLIQFDPATFENTFIPVANMEPMGADTSFNVAPATVFVPSNNRIYCFGGQSYSWTQDFAIPHNEIFYIDLSPLQGGKYGMPSRPKK